MTAVSAVRMTKQVDLVHNLGLTLDLKIVSLQAGGPTTTGQDSKTPISLVLRLRYFHFNYVLMRCFFFNI